MTKAELVKIVAKEASLSAKLVDEVIEKSINAIKQNVANGEQVVLRNFGTFQMKHRAEKKARNISKGTEMVIPAKDVPTFKASKFFLEND